MDPADSSPSNGGSAAVAKPNGTLTQTPVLRDTIDPKWDFQSTCSYNCDEHEDVQFEVYDESQNNQLLGKGTLPRSKLLDVDGGYAGTLYLRETMVVLGKATLEVVVKPTKTLSKPRSGIM